MKFSVLTFLCFIVPFLAQARLDSDPLNLNENIQTVSKFCTKESGSAKSNVIDEAELCSNPEKVLCDRVQFDQTKKVKEELKGAPVARDALVQKFSKFRTDQATRKEYIENCVRVENQIYEKLKLQGITRESVIARVRVTQKSLIAKIKTSSSFSKQKLGDAAISQIEKAKFRDANSLSHSEGFSNYLEVKSFYENCGVDGLEANAFYSGGEFTICPGYLISMVGDGRGPEALDLGVGHELAHSIDPMVEFDGTKNAFQIVYSDYLSCADQSFGKKLTAPSTVLKNIDKALDELKKKIKLSVQKDSREQSAYEYFKMLKGSLQYQWSEFSYFSITSPIQTHSQELAADYFGTEILAETLMKAKPEARVGILRDNLGPIPCDALVNEAQLKFLGTKGDDGFHPPADLRLQMIINHPVIWESLGCNKFGKPKPNCKIQ